MKLKTIKVKGQRTEEVYDSWGYSYLYPDGTKRLILDYSIFPKTLNGDKRKGLQVIEQKGTIDCSAGADDVAYINKWEDSCYLDKSAVEIAKVILHLRKKKIGGEILKETVNDAFFNFDSQLVARLLE